MIGLLSRVLGALLFLALCMLGAAFVLALVALVVVGAVAALPIVAVVWLVRRWR